MRKLKVAWWVAALLIALLPRVATPVGLGQLTVLSMLGEPLNAEIDLVSVTPSELGSLSANLASVDAYRKAKLQYHPAMDESRVSIERRPNGQPYVKIVSNRPVNEPFIDLLVEITSSSGRLTREYTALVDLPGAGTLPTPKADAPAVTRVGPTPEPASAATPPAVEAPVASTLDLTIGEPRDVVRLSRGEPPRAAGTDVGRPHNAPEHLRALEEEVTAREKALDERDRRIEELERTIKDMQKLSELKSPSMASVQQQQQQQAQAPGTTQGGTVILRAKPAPKPMAKAPTKSMQKAQPKPKPEPDPAYALVEVLFGTDRERLGGEDWNEYFGNKESEFRYGVTKVSIPARHTKGDLERPLSLLFFEFPENPEKHVMLREIAVQDRDAFLASLRARLGKSSRSQALLFVHGFNNTFADAARRTAQLAYDLDFKGVPIFYSWPSFGSAGGYMADTETIKLATGKLRGFLDQLLQDTQAQELFLIAHSMGNEALTRAFIDVVAKRPADRGRIKEFVLVAPDIDSRIFTREIGPALAAAGAGVTLYAASDDVALKSAKTIRAGFPRAGDMSDGVVILKGIETVDATGADTSFLGHAYFVTRDMYYLINSGTRAPSRNLTSIRVPQGQYWKLPQDRP